MSKMKVEDLRIGNLIYIDVCDGYNELVTWETIRDLSQDPLDDAFKPIPLTEDWLLKFGFDRLEFNSEDYGYSVEYNLRYGRGSAHHFIIRYCDDFSVSISGSEDDIGITPYLETVKHVHQLQNLYFALTGEELTIKE